MIKNIFIPSFHSLDEGIQFMNETEYKTLFSIGISWNVWYNVDGVEITDIEEQKDSVIISNKLPIHILSQSGDYEIDKWYYDGEFIFMFT